MARKAKPKPKAKPPVPVKPQVPVPAPVAAPPRPRHQPGDLLRVGQVVLYDGEPHAVIRVTPCSAYVRPVARPNEESVTISAHAFCPIVEPLYQSGDITLMPTLKQVEAGIEEYCSRELVKPIAAKLYDMHAAIQKELAKEFNDDHDGPVEAFANRIADGVYDAVVVELNAQKLTRPPANEERRTPLPRSAVIGFGPKHGHAVLNGRVLDGVRTSPATGAVAITHDGTTELLTAISDADYEKAVAWGIPILFRAPTPAGASQPSAKTAGKPAGKAVAALPTPRSAKRPPAPATLRTTLQAAVKASATPRNAKGQIQSKRTAKRR